MPHSITVDTNNRLGLQVNTSVVKKAFHNLNSAFTDLQDGAEINLSCGFFSLGWLLQNLAHIMAGGRGEGDGKSCPIIC